MEGLFNERLQVRTRHLEERVSALTKQLAAQKEDNARLHKSHSDATHKVQSLEGDLKSERERCHKLSATLSSFRSHATKKILRSGEGDYGYYDNDLPSSRLPGNGTIYYQCGQCGGAAAVHHDRNYQLLPNYMGIMPARLNHKLSKPKKMNRSKLNRHKIAYDGQVDLRRPGLSIDMGDHYQYCSCDQTSDCDIVSCADCCRNVEIFLARRLHLNDYVQQECSTASGFASQSLTSKRQNQSRQLPSLPISQLHQGDSHLLHNIARKHNYRPPVSKQQPIDQSGIINPSTTIENAVNAKMVEQDLQSLTTLSAEGFYVKMETATADNQQQRERPATSCGFDSGVDHGCEHIVSGDYHDLWSLQCVVRALKAENKALRDALLSSRKVEIQELESELQDIKQCASGATIPSNRKVNLSCDKIATKFNDGANTSNDNSDLKFYDRSQVDPIKFLDSLQKVEDKILKKKVAILGLESEGVHIGDANKVSFDDYPLSSGGVQMKAHLNEELRHLLKALAREVVLL